MKLSKEVFGITELEGGLYRFEIKNIKQFEDCYFYANDSDFLTIGGTINFFFKDLQSIVLFKGNDVEFKNYQWIFLEQMLVKGESVKH